MNEKGQQGIEASHLGTEPTRQGSLPSALLARIEGLSRIFAEVNGQPAADWVKVFELDQNPEREFVIGETMGAAYLAFAKNRSLTVEAKVEAFALLMMRSINDEPMVLKQAPLKHLGRADVLALLAAFDGVTSAAGSGFPSRPLAPPGFCPASSDHPDDSSVPQIDEEFTIRDEANALTAFAYRNGFIEELHAGKRSPLLDDPDYSRITDDEMRRLMIQASEKLAQMLILKRSSPGQYEAKIRDYHDKYCRAWKRE